MASNWEEKKRPAKNHLTKNSDERAGDLQGLKWGEAQAEA